MVHTAAFDEVLLAAQGDAGWAFTQIYNALAPAVAGYVRAQAVRDADDIVNEVFLAAFTRIGSFRGNEAQFRSWVFTIAHHRIVDARRAARRRPWIDSFDAADASAGVPAPGSVEDEALASVGLGRLQPVLDRLTPEQREVVVLRVVADLSVEGVARIVGKRPGAVRAVQHRAINALRDALATEAVTR